MSWGKYRKLQNFSAPIEKKSCNYTIQNRNFR